MVPESKVAFPYERQAMNGDEMPPGLDYPDQVTYLCFRMLYAQLRGGIVDREPAVPCVVSGFTWKTALTASTCCGSGIQRSGICG